MIRPGSSTVLLVAVLAAACGGAASAPTPPTISTAAVRSLHVDGPAIVVGDRKAFTATATFADGTQQNVSAQATWSSSDPTVATVDATGLVTGVSEGNVDIHASFRGASDSIYRNITPLLFFKASGTVSETPPGFSTVAGARVEVIAGSNLGTATTTDAAGRFSFGTMRGDDYTLKVTRSGYQDLTQKVSLTRDLDNITLLVFPVPPAGATARCKDRSWSDTTDRSSACAKNGGVAYWVCPGPFC